ncbi:hypothetical protein L486_07206 [Kwoniella mangroviensis CBS 10435]|uniref:Uncharacterized protein n=1 Tax=Kwoniella mangroviensis CBS 10435 TaxID=1331196 RepID=A0A1B9IHT9_9TREE|nr:hypothetical protein L486_07206 [Kwoniella mangroviensis CBS 10435]
MPFWPSRRRNPPSRSEPCQFSDWDTCFYCGSGPENLFNPRQEGGAITVDCSTCRKRTTVYNVPQETRREPDTTLPSDAVCDTCRGRRCFMRSCPKEDQSEDRLKLVLHLQSNLKDQTSIQSKLKVNNNNNLLVTQNNGVETLNDTLRFHNNTAQSRGKMLEHDLALRTFDEAARNQDAWGVQLSEARPTTLLPAYRPEDENTHRQLDPTQNLQNTQQRQDARAYDDRFGG